MLGNANFDGAAPGAKIVSARACSWGGGCTAAALTDGMVELVVNRGVDVVNMSIGGLPAFNDGNNARDRLYDRLIQDYGVQMFISAGNDGPGVNTLGDPSTATEVVSVAAGISQETYLANYGSVTRTPYQLFNFSSRGPREDGAFKPNITAPGSALSTTPLWQPGIPVAEAGYQLPPGIQMINGTSMSSPQATGAAALLLSAAKATGKDASPAKLRRAIYSSATWIDGVSAQGQGNGMFNVPGAWDLLAGGVEVRGYDVSAPVCSTALRPPGDPGQGRRDLQPVRDQRGRPAAGRREEVHRQGHPDQPAQQGHQAHGPLGRRRRHLPQRAEEPDPAAEQDRDLHGRGAGRLRHAQRHHAGGRPGDLGGRLRVPQHGRRLQRADEAELRLRRPAARSTATTTRATSSPCPRARPRCRSTSPGLPPARRPASSRSTRTAFRSRAPRA